MQNVKCILGMDLLDAVCSAHTAATVRLRIKTYSPTQSQDADTGPTWPSTDHGVPGDWQARHKTTSFSVTGRTEDGGVPPQGQVSCRSMSVK